MYTNPPQQKEREKKKGRKMVWGCGLIVGALVEPAHGSVGWHTSAIPALEKGSRRLRRFKAILGYAGNSRLTCAILVCEALSQN